MAASALLTLVSGVVLAATFLWWRWHARPRPTKGGRDFGAFEHVMHHLREECGHHNMSLVLRFHERLDCERLRTVLRLVQMRHALLQSTVVTDKWKRPSFRRLDDPPPIVLLEEIETDDASAESAAAVAKKDDEAEGSEADARSEDLRILTRELNTGFESNPLLLRCTVMQPPPPALASQRTKSSDGAGVPSSEGGGRARVRLVITVAHDMMDGKSLALLGAEIVELYRSAELQPTGFYSQRPDDALSPLPPLPPSFPHPAPIPPPIEEVMLPSWVPRPVWFLSHLLGFFMMHRFLLYDRVQALPHTAFNIPSPATRPLWSTGVIERRLSREETARLQKNGRRMGASVSVQLTTAAFLAITSGALKRRANVWGVLLVDMRRQLMVHQLRQSAGSAGLISPPPSPTALGQFLSSIDLCHPTDPVILPSTDDDGGDDPASLSAFLSSFRDQCGIVRTRMEGLMRQGGHLTSLIFAQYLAAFSALHSRYFVTPFPCPGFSMSNVGSMDDAAQPGPLEDIVRALNGRNPTLEDMAFGVSAASSFPFVSITVLTFRGSLRVVFSYPTNTIAPTAINELADAYLRVLRLAATEGAHEQKGA